MYHISMKSLSLYKNNEFVQYKILQALINAWVMPAKCNVIVFDTIILHKIEYSFKGSIYYTYCMKGLLNCIKVKITYTHVDMSLTVLDKSVVCVI